MVLTFQPGSTSENHVVNHVVGGRKNIIEHDPKTKKNPPTFSMVFPKNQGFRCLATKWGILRQTRQVYNLALVNAKDLKRSKWSDMLWKIPGWAWDLPIGEPWKDLASWDIFQVAIPNSRYFEKLWLIPNWLLWIVIALPWHLRLRFFFQKKPIHWSMYCTIPWLNHQVVLCSSSSLEFQKNHPQHSEPPNFGKSRKRLHVFMVRSTYVGSVQTCNVSAYEHLMPIHTGWCCRNPKANNLEMSKKTLVFIMVDLNYQPPSTGFRWSRISCSKKPQQYALKTLLLFHAGVTPASFAGSCGRVTRLRFSFGLGEEVALLQGRQNVPTVGIHVDPENAKPCFIKWMANGDFSSQPFFSMVKIWKKSSNCKLQEALPSGPRWEFYWLDGSCVNLSCEYELCTSGKQQGDPAWRQCLRWSAWRMRKRPWIIDTNSTCL